MRAHYSYLKGDNVAVAQCPASCGELIQGWILGSEKLVSCPVDWYSTVAVTAAPPLVNERPLSRAMVERVLAHWQYPAHWSNEIRVDVRSSIPLPKAWPAAPQILPLRQWQRRIILAIRWMKLPLHSFASQSNPLIAPFFIS